MGTKRVPKQSFSEKIKWENMNLFVRGGVVTATFRRFVEGLVRRQAVDGDSCGFLGHDVRNNPEADKAVFGYLIKRIDWDLEDIYRWANSGYGRHFGDQLSDCKTLAERVQAVFKHFDNKDMLISLFDPNEPAAVTPWTKVRVKIVDKEP
jgi:hypothetical protein